MNLAIVFDCETQGLPQYNEPSEGENQPHIVQLAANQVDLDSGRVLQSMDVIIKPDGWTIPSEVSAIHGITTEHALDVGIPEKLAVEMFLDLWGGRMRIAHNVSFDNRIIRIATKRFFSEDICEVWKGAPSECTGMLSKPIMQMLPKGRFGYKMPKLSEAYLHFTGKELQNAHSALADTNACMEVYFAIKRLDSQAA